MTEAAGISSAGRVALVTGGASGIGRAAARGLAGEGASLALVDRDEQRLRDTAASLRASGASCLEICCDLADAAACDGVVQQVEEALGPVRVLVNSAGVTGRRESLQDLERSEWDRIHAINLAAAVFLARAVAPGMLRAGRGGRIVNVSSASAHRARAFSVAYAASKAGLEGATRAMAGELAPHGVTVNAVAPGVTDTGIHPASDTYADLEARARSGPASNLLGQVASAEDVAATIGFLCGPGGAHITGQVIHVSGGSIV